LDFVSSWGTSPGEVEEDEEESAYLAIVSFGQSTGAGMKEDEPRLCIP
jgi:hypothetical protein